VSIKPMKDQAQAIQLKYSALKKPADPWIANHPALMQFTHQKPNSIISIEMPSEKNDGIEQAMLKYIVDKYGNHGENILSPREENLLPLYIEGYLLKQNFTDPQGEFHTILQLVREAGEKSFANGGKSSRFRP
jgi:hypothetical protein